MFQPARPRLAIATTCRFVDLAPSRFNPRDRGARSRSVPVASDRDDLDNRAADGAIDVSIRATATSDRDDGAIGHRTSDVGSTVPTFQPARPWLATATPVGDSAPGPTSSFQSTRPWLAPATCPMWCCSYTFAGCFNPRDRGQRSRPARDLNKRGLRHWRSSLTAAFAASFQPA